MEVLGGNPILAESAQQSVMPWKFSPSSSETLLELSVRFDPHAESGLGSQACTYVTEISVPSADSGIQRLHVRMKEPGPEPQAEL